MTQRDYFLTTQTPEGQRTTVLHVECALEALEVWTNAVRIAQGTNSARSIECFSMVDGNPLTKQVHWQIVLYSVGVF